MNENNFGYNSKIENFGDECNVEALYSGEDAEGFDAANGGEWLYPTNYPVRTYQKNIVSNALFKNTLVCLPTGLGKTFIAAVVMYNYLRWYPKHIVVFMAHSKPLVKQQVDACCNIMGIPSSLIAELNGNMLHSKRKTQWETKKIFFLTPQVFNNDLARGIVNPQSIRCLVIDEAHKALGNQAYCQVIRSLKPFNSNFRVLALSATPGECMRMVGEVIQNLMISHLELYNEDHPDIKPYLHEKITETVVVELDDKIIQIKEQLLRAVDKYVKPLMKNKLIPQSYSSINPFSLVLKQRQFMQNPSVSTEMRGILLSNFSVAISLFHALEELVIHGMRSFVAKLKSLQSGEGSTSKTHHRIAKDDDIKSLIEYVDNILGPDRYISFDVDTSLTRIFDEIDGIDPAQHSVYSHPKFSALQKIIQNHFESEKESTRVIVFCKSRQTTGEICNFLARFKPLVKPMIFIGQSQSASGLVTKGFNQAAQLTVMKRFRDGIYNTLVATCVAEEGLDIGEVDLIVNFDSGKNSNTQVQRSGRTGRKRNGRVVNLVTKGKEHADYNTSIANGKRMNKQLVRNAKTLPFYAFNPRLIPREFNPVCQEMFFSTKKITEEEEKAPNRKSKIGVKKKLCDVSKEENIMKKRRKIWSNSQKTCNLWTRITDNNYEIAGQEDNNLVELVGGNDNEKVVDLKEDGNFISPLKSDNDIHIIDVKVERKMILYNDDVEESTDKNGESFSFDEPDSIIKDFLRKNNSALKPKTKFNKLINLQSFEKYFKFHMKDSDLINKMKQVEKYRLSKSDMEWLQNVDISVEKFVANINELRKKALFSEFRTPKVKSKKSREKENLMQKNKLENEELKLIDEINVDDFLQPFEEFSLSTETKIISSTPMGKVKEEEKKGGFDSLFSEQGFKSWNKNDFSKNNFTCDVTEANLSNRNDMSLISITQALDIVNNANRDYPIENELQENNKKSTSPSSPILFFSQKPKLTRNNCELGSPILTQKFGSKRTSRKCLGFKDKFSGSSELSSQDNENLVSDVNGDGDGSDLFAETEIALENHMKELEEKLNEIEKHEYEMKEGKNPASMQNDAESNENTQEYDLGDFFNQENNFSSFVNAKNKSKVSLLGKICMENNIDKNMSGNISSEHNLKSFLSSNNESEKEETSHRAMTYSHGSIPKCSVNGNSSSISLKTGPKMAVVRPIGFENSPLCLKKDMINDNKMEEAKKDEKPSLSCSFSLFDGDEFSQNFSALNEENKSRIVSTGENVKKLENHWFDDDSSNDSDVFAGIRMRSNFKALDKSNFNQDMEIKQKLEDEENLSDGAIEAIKAVEIYKKDVKLADKVASKLSNTHLDSDDSGDFLPVRKQVKEVTASSDSHVTKKRKIKGKTKKEKVSGNNFIETEAEISHTSNISSDEENTSGLDEYDSSFVDEREVFTQAQEVDMTSKYLQSTKSPFRPGGGIFKIPKITIQENFNVFSQIMSEGESEYENDSFCVSEEERVSEVQDISELELAEIILQENNKRKRNKEQLSGSFKKKKKKRRRVQRIESDSSEDEVKEVKAQETDESNYDKQKEQSEIELLFASPLSTETETSTSQYKIENKKMAPVIFVASRQIASAPEITTCLRAKWSVDVHVRSAPDAEYIVSWRVGVNRIHLSDFANGGPAAKNNLREIILKLSSNFVQPILIVEDDKNKGLPQTTGFNRIMWAKHSCRTLVEVIEKDIKLIFSRNKEETARILILLCKDEIGKGYGINLATELSSETERKLKFYSTLPGVNVANALRLSQKFLTLSSFLKCCDSVQAITRELNVKREYALRIYQLLFVAPSS